ncbi:MAG: peptidylprolyl isomerase [Chitinophagaceae bacterium]
MVVTKNKMVSIRYSVTDAEGIIVDSNTEFEPLHYLHGAGNILPALEYALEGAREMEEKQVILLPRQAYGEYNEKLVVAVNKEAFQGSLDTAEPGMTVEDIDGHILEIMEILPDKVIVNGNHPLAGKVLHFKLCVSAIREATERELISGQPEQEDEVCGSGCCC